MLEKKRYFIKCLVIFLKRFCIFTRSLLLKRKFFNIILLVILLYMFTICLQFRYLKEYSSKPINDAMNIIGNKTIVHKNSVDVVYTWVNGSDTQHVKNLNYYKFKEILKNSEKIDLDSYFKSSFGIQKTCHHKNCLQTNNLFIVIPKIDNLKKKQFVSSCQKSFHQVFNSNLTITDVRMEYGEIHIVELIINDLTIISLNRYTKIASNIEEFENLYKLFKRLLNKHKIYIGLYTTDCSLAYNCIRNISNNLNIVWDLGIRLNDGLDHNRFVDKNELKYSLRSLELYLPWIANVYLVTNGQVPDWLNLSNSKIRIINHSQIFEKKSHLPTFNSAAIEANLHRIKDLSDRFLYVNDDVLFVAPVYLDDFYSNKTLKIYFTRFINFYSQFNKCDELTAYECSLRYSYGVLDGAFKKASKRIVPPHMPFLIEKAIVQELETTLKNEFQRTSANRFRSQTDLQFSFTYYNFILSKLYEINSEELLDIYSNDTLQKFNVSYDLIVKCNSYNKFIDSQMCKSVNNQLRNIIESIKHKYKYEIFKKRISNQFSLNNENGFELINMNLNYSENFTKFLCINDEINYDDLTNAKSVFKYLEIFYEKNFPKKSSFEK